MVVFSFLMLFLILQEDLVHTIGESASQGAAGIILWGSKNYSCSQVSDVEDESRGVGIKDRKSTAISGWHSFPQLGGNV